MGIKVKGKVMDNKKEVVAEFETNELGIGSFTFNPFKDQQYMAEVTFEDGSVSSAKLPETQSSGISVAVNPFMQDRIAAQYSFSPDRVDQKEVYLLVQHLGELLYVAKQKVSKSELLFMIPKKICQPVSIRSHYFLKLACLLSKEWSSAPIRKTSFR